MTNYSIQNQLPVFLSATGAALNAGKVYIGLPNQDPQTFPKAVYWNQAGTDPVDQANGIDVIGGYITRAGSPATIYISGSYSVRVRDRFGVQVYYIPEVNDDITDLIAQFLITTGAGMLGYSLAATYPAGTVGKKLQQQLNPIDAPYYAVGDAVADDSAALSAAAGAHSVFITGNHRIKSNITLTNLVTFLGNGCLTIDPGVTVTFTQGIIVAPDRRIFYGAGTVAGIKNFQAEWITEADGVTDDTAGLQKAITCVGSSGILCLGPKSWKITDLLTVAGDHARIVGSGRKATKIRQFDASKGALLVTGSYFSMSALSLEYDAQGTAGGVAIDFNAAFYSTIEELHIFKSYIGVQYRAAANSHTGQRIFVEDATKNSVLCLNSPNVVWSEFQLINSNTTTLGTEGCIRLEGAGTEGCNFFNGHTNQGVYSLTTSAPAYGFGSMPAYNKFHGVYFDGATGAVVDKTAEIDFIDCWFSSRPGPGLYLAQVDGIRVNGGGAINCGQDGVFVEGAAKRVSIKNFAARSNSVASAGTYSGITFAAGATDFVVQGCICTNTLLSFGTQKYGIEVRAGASDRYVIKDNLIGGNGTAGVSDDGTGVNKSVSENY